MLTAVSLFAGIEGIGLALERAGIQVVAAVEKDAAARGVIADHFPETALFTDVTEVTADELRATGFVPERGILTAGWPCQGNSVAGRRGGLSDPRSGLWRHVVRLLAELRPRWFLGENVPGLLSVTDGEDFGRVLQDLADIGYGFAYRVLDAQFFGVPQRRRRVFIVGCLGDPGRPVEVLLEPESCGRDSAPSREAGTQAAGAASSGVGSAGIIGTLTTRSGDSLDDQQTTQLVVSALTANGVGTCGADDNQAQSGHLIPISVTGDRTHTLTAEGHDASEDSTGRGTPVIAFAWQAGGNKDASGALSEELSPTLPRNQTMAIQTTDTTVRRLTPTECERLQGFPDDWTATSWGKPQADGPRYRQLGNAVAVPCVEWIARRIVASEVAAC